MFPSTYFYANLRVSLGYLATLSNFQAGFIYFPLKAVNIAHGSLNTATNIFISGIYPGSDDFLFLKHMGWKLCLCANILCNISILSILF